jgi:hypothetical protein
VLNEGVMALSVAKRSFQGESVGSVIVHEAIYRASEVCSHAPRIVPTSLLGRLAVIPPHFVSDTR